MKLTESNGRDPKARRQLPRPAASPDSFTLRQLDEAMRWLREIKRERKLTHVSSPAS
jgi:hypothetical protein